jgi:Trk K+ transport system NAD-binding subunit
MSYLSEGGECRMQGHYELRHECYTSYLKSTDVDSMDTFRVQTENTNHNIILSTLYVAFVTPHILKKIHSFLTS